MNLGRILLLAGALAAAFTLPAVAQPATDSDTLASSSKPRFQVADGDTVKFGPQLVRLFGIDAPEKGQSCDDGAWRPGPLAKKAFGGLHRRPPGVV